jgi:sortase (surface protein transpeptidase)
LALATPSAAQAQEVGSEPVHIDIPNVGIHAAVVPVGDDLTGAMGVPTDPDTVGWYAPGVGTGTPGNALLDGHVDWGGRLRAFGWLKLVQPGDTIQISNADGQVFWYSVQWIQLFDAANAPVDDIFAETPDSELTLITCGGEFDHAIHMYLSRWVVRAVQINPPLNIPY